MSLWSAPPSGYEPESQVHLDAVEDQLGQVGHRDPPVHGPALEAAEGLLLGPAEALHEDALGPLDDLAVDQAELEGGVLGGQLAQLAEAGPGHQQGRPELAGVDRL